MPPFKADFVYDAPVTLRTRLLLSAFVLSLATTIALALVVRASWQEAEELRFRNQFDQAVSDIEARLGGAADELKTRLSPLCAHDPIVDSALVGLKSGTLATRMLSLRARVPELMRSLELDELALVTSDGQVLGGETRGPGGASLAELTRSRFARPTLRAEDPVAFEAACLKQEGNVWIGLLAARHVRPLLVAAGESHDLRLTLVTESPLAPEPLPTRDSHMEERPLAFLPGARLRAERSRLPLRANLQDLDAQVLTAAFTALGGAFLLALFLSRGLARPVIRFAEQTRKAVQGTVQELPVSGGPELEEAARAFNATLADLQGLRDRLKVTERIAARREVARQIAHEIKNPLSPIRTSIETLRKLKERNLPEFDSYFRETTTTILSEVARITTLVNHFSEYARVPSPRPAEFILEDLITRLVDLHQGLGADVRFTRPPSDHPITADPEQVTQVLTNLIKNAIEATAHLPDARVEVAVDERREGHTVLLLISVSDNGDGLRSDQVAKIFEPYVTTKKDGSGLGLPISHRIAVEHGGDLTYTTPPRGGARFVFSLPTKGPPVLAEPAD